MSRRQWLAIAVIIGPMLLVSVFQFTGRAPPLEQLAEQAAAPLKVSRFTIDSHGRDASARSRRAQAFGQLEQAGAPAIPVLLDMRSNPDRSVSQRATTALRNTSRRLGPTTVLLIELLDRSTRPTVADWSEEALRDIGSAQPAVPAVMRPLTDQRLRAEVVLELAGAQWKGVTQSGTAAGPLQLLMDAMQQAAGSQPASSAGVKDLELLYRQVMGAKSILLDDHHIRDLPPVTELVDQLDGPNPVATISGLRRIAESNASVAGLDLGELTPNLSPAVPALTRLTNTRQRHLKAHAVAILGLIDSEGRDNDSAFQRP